MFKKTLFVCIPLVLMSCFTEPVKHESKSSSSQGLSSSSISVAQVSSSSVNPISSVVSSSSSSLAVSSFVGDASTLVISAELRLGGRYNATIGSYLDLDGALTFSGSTVIDPMNAAKVDLQYAPDSKSATFLTPSASTKAELKTNGNQTLVVANVGAIDLSKITKQYQVDSILAAVPLANVKNVVSAMAGEYLVMKTSEGVATLVSVVSADTSLAGVAVIKAIQK